jgi:hypothetical protein
MALNRHQTPLTDAQALVSFDAHARLLRTTEGEQRIVRGYRYYDAEIILTTYWGSWPLEPEIPEGTHSYLASIVLADKNLMITVPADKWSLFDTKVKAVHLARRRNIVLDLAYGYAVLNEAFNGGDNDPDHA